MLKVAPVAGITTLGIPALGAPGARERYSPTYFTPSEWEFVLAAVARLIPDDAAGAGGVQAGVPEFIDRQLEMPYGHGAYFYMKGPFQPDLAPTLGYQLPFTPRELYRKGIAEAERACLKSHGGRFSSLSAGPQDAFLHLLESGKAEFNGLPSAAFFAQLLGNTKEGYFADPMHGGNRDMVSWKLIGFPGARADFTDWMDQQGRPYPYGPVSINGSKK
jgi:gluconate 2-dehydrogenase gamma chain